MDVDFLAGGALLEIHPGELPATPSVPAMLRAAAPGPASDRLLDDYAWLRALESAARWRAGRPVESLPGDEAELAVVAELVEPGGSTTSLRERLAATRARIRNAWNAVVEAGSIAALEG